MLLLPGNSQFNFFPPLIAVIVDFICMEFYTISSIMYFFGGPAMMGFNHCLSRIVNYETRDSPEGFVAIGCPSAMYSTINTCNIHWRVDISCIDLGTWSVLLIWSRWYSIPILVTRHMWYMCVRYAIHSDPKVLPYTIYCTGNWSSIGMTPLLSTHLIT